MLFPVLPLPGKRERALAYLRARCVESAFLGAWHSSLLLHNKMARPNMKAQHKEKFCNLPKTV